MLDEANQTITTTSGKRFTSKEHGALARLIYQRFGEDITAATNAWRRMLQNSATESDFREMLTWQGVPEFQPPDPEIAAPLIFDGWRGLRRLALATLRDALKSIATGRITAIYITEFTDLTIAGNFTVQSQEDGTKLHRFHAILDDGFTTLRACGKSKRIR